MFNQFANFKSGLVKQKWPKQLEDKKREKESEQEFLISWLRLFGKTLIEDD